MNRHAIVAGVVSSALAGLGLFAAPSPALPPAHGPSPSAAATPPSVYESPRELDHSVSVRDAIALADAQGLNVGSYLYSNGQVVGGFTPTDQYTVDDFLAEFAARYGTEPQVISLVVQTDAKQTVRSTVITGTAADFVAPPTEVSNDLSESGFVSEPIDEAGKFGASIRSAGLDTEWKPEHVAVEMFRGTGTVDVVQYVDWGLYNTPQGVPSGFGTEYEINLYADEDLGPGQPLCDTDFEGEFVGDVRNKSWQVVSPTTSGSTLEDAGVYWDSGSFDSCDKMTLSVGIRYPELIVNDVNENELVVFVTLDATSEQDDRLDAYIQLVADYGCDVWETAHPLTPAPLAYCMGTLGGGPPTSAENPRRVLSDLRAWYGPELCWYSDDYGDRPPEGLDYCGVPTNAAAVPVTRTSEKSGSDSTGWDITLYHYADDEIDPNAYPYSASFPAADGDGPSVVNLGYLVDVHLWIGGHEVGIETPGGTAGHSPWEITIDNDGGAIALHNDALKFTENSASTIYEFLQSGQISFRTGLNAPRNWMSLNGLGEWWDPLVTDPRDCLPDHLQGFPEYDWDDDYPLTLRALYRDPEWCGWDLESEIPELTAPGPVSYHDDAPGYLDTSGWSDSWVPRTDDSVWVPSNGSTVEFQVDVGQGWATFFEGVQNTDYVIVNNAWTDVSGFDDELDPFAITIHKWLRTDMGQDGQHPECYTVIEAPPSSCESYRTNIGAMSTNFEDGGTWLSGLSTSYTTGEGWYFLAKYGGRVQFTTSGSTPITVYLAPGAYWPIDVTNIASRSGH